MSDRLNQHFGFKTFRQGQESVISRLVNGESAVAIFPTGAGKSLCYQLPALMLPGLTLVVSPLLSLMKDQLDYLLSQNIPAARLDSTLGRNEYNAILENAKSVRLKILMISVERFKNERFRNRLKTMNVSLLAVDEAHCISEWGHNFRPEYLKLPDYRDEFNIPQVLLLTATATTQVVKDMCQRFSIPDSNVTITGFYRENLYLQVSPVAGSNKNEKLYTTISSQPESPSIIYVTLQKTAEKVAEFLVSKGIGAAHYHAGLKSDEREQIQDRFIQGDLRCIVATIAFGMGIDKKDIRRVIHYDLPKSLENYSQEIGRSGRDGEKSFCEVFADKDTIITHENFVYGDTPERSSIRGLLEIIKANETPLLELKLVSLSRELDIRPLPLKTLLVYLDMHGILKPRYAYFQEYSFKFNQPPEQIAGSFEGERRTFVSTLFNCCETKKTWTYLNMERATSAANSDRKRVVAALDYFDEKGWVELQAKQSVDVYDILNNQFDPEQTADTLHALFVQKETREIKRIHTMLSFFESNTCISRKLAAYFGETISKENCGHCSFCATGTGARFTESKRIFIPQTYNASEIITKIREKTGTGLSLQNTTKLLCGIQTPLFFKLKVKSMPEFGLLENYPFQVVKDWLTGS
ncbi:MAG: RecQ family ATP-dependent DNA helicase [Proteobacteria bacterium]|nr:RecQ family ATP-dependent DNA helicase [Pseudomonadota bacterium]